MIYPLKMVWRDLLFAHWPVDPALLQPLLPLNLKPDLAEGKAWVSLVPFRMTGVGPRFLPGHRFPELNVRTYVRCQAQPGVWFFSLDAASRLAVHTARRFFHLNYCEALMSVQQDDGWIEYRSQRTHAGPPPALLDMRYRPNGPARPAAPGSLEHWLTERYCFVSAHPHTGRLYRGDIRHQPWSLQPALAEFRTQAMTSGLGFTLDGPPALLAYAEALPVQAALVRAI